MPVLCDFAQIVGDSPITIGDCNTGWQQNFNTEGREPALSGFLVFNVSHFTHSDRDVVVSINGTQVGVIHNYRPSGAGIDTTNINQPEKWRRANHWYTQMITFSGDQINDGNNTLQIQVVEFPENTLANRFDDFHIKNMYCFFHRGLCAGPPCGMR